ncbi:MAG: hypothetical protein IPH75_06020 [bacterium]|nr:hypothetical protein [bacterium]
MTFLLLVGWLSLPLAPLNPVAQDTIAAMNLHVTAGITSPNGIVSASPEISFKYEFRPAHPLIVRSEVDFRFGSVGTRFWPDGKEQPAMYLEGNYRTALLAADLLYYRGTDHLTAYLGVGIVQSFNEFDADQLSRDILKSQYDIDKIDMSQKIGYRFTLGLRFNRSYAFEVAITQMEPHFVFGRDYGDGTYSKEEVPTQFSSFRFTFGYLWELKSL